MSTQSNRILQQMKAASLNSINLQQVIRAPSLIVNKHHMEAIENFRKNVSYFTKLNTEHINRLANSFMLSPPHSLIDLSHLYNILDKHREWLSEIKFTENDYEYAIDVIEKDEWESFINQDFPEKEKEELLKEEKSLFVKLQLVVDVITLIFTFIFPPFEVNVTNIQENYNIHIENATFYSDKEGIKWLNDELAKEHLEQNYRIVTKDNLVVRTEKKKNSHIVETLHTGNIVQLIKKERNWSYIMYADPDNGDLFSGWTNTRYLKSIGNRN